MRDNVFALDADTKAAVTHQLCARSCIRVTGTSGMHSMPRLETIVRSSYTVLFLPFVPVTSSQRFS